MLLKMNEMYDGVHEVRILTADVRDAKIPVYKISFRIPRMLRFFDFFFRGIAFYKGIRKVRKSYDFDLILFGNAMSGLVTKWLNPGVPVGGMINDDHTLIITLSNFLRYEGGKSLLLLKFVEGICARYLDFIITCSDYLRSAVLKRYKCQPQRIQRLYQGIDVMKIPFQERVMNAGQPIKILFVKYRYLLGGLQDLAKALASMRNYSFQVTIMGPDPENKVAIDRFFAGQSHIQVHFLGPQPQSVVHRQMAVHQILCIPSRLEAQGLANIEGMAHGLLVVSSNAGGIPEVLDQGKNGWMSQSGDSVSLVKKLEQCILADNKEKSAIAERARKFTEEHFHYPVMLENLVSILQSVPDKKKN